MSESMLSHVGYYGTCLDASIRYPQLTFLLFNKKNIYLDTLMLGTMCTVDILQDCDIVLTKTIFALNFLTH